MEFFEWLKQSLDGYQAIGLVLIALIGGLTKILGTFNQAADLHDKTIVRRRLERLLILRTDISENRPLATYLDNATEREKFRIASGVSTVSSAKMGWLMKLDATGLWSREQIKAVSSFLVTEPETGSTSLELGTVEKVQAVLSGIGGACVLLMGIGYLVIFGLKYGTLGLIAGVVLFGCFLIGARLFLADLVNYRVAKRVLRYLEHHPLPFSPAPQSPHPTES